MKPTIFANRCFRVPPLTQEGMDRKLLRRMAQKNHGRGIMTRARAWAVAVLPKRGRSFVSGADHEAEKWPPGRVAVATPSSSRAHRSFITSPESAQAHPASRARLHPGGPAIGGSGVKTCVLESTGKDPLRAPTPFSSSDTFRMMNLPGRFARRLCSFGTLMLCFGLAPCALAQTWTNGAGDNNWFNDANWSTNAVPTISSAANIAFGFPRVEVQMADAAASTLRVDNDLSVAGTGTLLVSETMTIGQFGGFPFVTVLGGARVSVGALDFRRGSLQVFGAGSTFDVTGSTTGQSTIQAGINVRDGGVFNVQDGAGALSVGPSGFILLSNGGTFNAGTVALEGPTSGVLFQNSGASNITFASVITGTGGVVANAGGTATLTGNNTFSGGTRVANGSRIILSHINALGSGGVELRGGLLFRASGSFANGIAFDGGGLNVAAASGETVALTGTLGTGSQARFGSIDGTGTVVLAPAAIGGVDQYGFGFISVAAGTLRLGNSLGAAFLGTARVTEVSAGATLDINGFPTTFRDTLRGTGTITNSGAAATITSVGATSTFAGVIQDGHSPISLMRAGPNLLTLSGTNTYSGTTTIAADASLQIGEGLATGSLGSGSIDNAGTLIIKRSNLFEMSNAIGGSGNIVHDGSGTTILTGTSDTYSGTTHINHGMVVVGSTATFGSGSATIHVDGGALDGTGTIGGTVHLDDGMLLGSAVLGTLTVGGNYVQGPAGALLLRIAGVSADEFDALRVHGNVFLDGTLAVEVAHGVELSIGNRFVVMTFGERNGSFARMSGLDLGHGLRLEPVFDAASLTLHVVAVPEPHQYGLMLTALMVIGWVSSRKRAAR